ncbi:MAG: efflux RND transporter periplasmic adaptor subunit [Minwuia sp.]|uniref:efflux RND transporter periplasmic adaptor subunit n=1 Tax=Minwuia sp. TaxID=2493630 RepID=UPI003A84AD67
MNELIGQNAAPPAASDGAPGSSGGGDDAAVERGIRRVRARRRTVTLIAALCILGVGVAGFMLLVATKPKPAPVARQETVYTVATDLIEITDNRPTLTVFGEIAAGRETDLRALVAGDVVETAPQFRNGGAVRQGDMLLRIDPFDYEAAARENRARIAESRSRIRSESDSLTEDREMLRLREADVARIERLHGKGNISDKTRDQALIELAQQKQKVAQRESAIQTERAKLDQLQVALDRAERDLGRTDLTAPFDGFLSQVSAQRGTVVGSNDRVAHLTGADALEARGHLSDAQYGRLLQDGGLEGRRPRCRGRSATRKSSMTP